jgi:hypothetical protein
MKRLSFLPRVFLAGKVRPPHHLRAPVFDDRPGAVAPRAGARFSAAGHARVPAAGRAPVSAPADTGDLAA